mmetsp:Transcript_24136/g.91072  ORF Transcript_24136/g.91072 Transcript_24136/m.91072 type:complete len:395 (-) Transcript_24136:472-1656(-)
MGRPLPHHTPPTPGRRLLRLERRSLLAAAGPLHERRQIQPLNPPQFLWLRMSPTRGTASPARPPGARPRETSPPPPQRARLRQRPTRERAPLQSRLAGPTGASRGPEVAAGRGPGAPPRRRLGRPRARRRRPGSRPPRASKRQRCAAEAHPWRRGRWQRRQAPSPGGPRERCGARAAGRQPPQPGWRSRYRLEQLRLRLGRRAGAAPPRRPGLPQQGRTPGCEARHQGGGRGRRRGGKARPQRGPPPLQRLHGRRLPGHEDCKRRGRWAGDEGRSRRGSPDPHHWRRRRGQRRRSLRAPARSRGRQRGPGTRRRPRAARQCRLARAGTRAGLACLCLARPAGAASRRPGRPQARKTSQQASTPGGPCRGSERRATGRAQVSACSRCQLGRHRTP